MFVYQQAIDSILLEVLYRKVITSQTVTICNNLNIYQQMIKQEETKIRKSISEKIKKKYEQLNKNLIKSTKNYLFL